MTGPSLGHATQPLRINVLSRMDPARPRTHGIAAFRMCSGLAAQGNDVTLVVPAISRPSPSSDELFATYELEPTFEIRYLPVGHGTDRYETRTVARMFGRHILDATRVSRSTVVLSDDTRFLLPYVVTGHLRNRRLLTAPWLHAFQGQRRERFVCARASCVLATNSAILRDLSESGASNPRTFITGNPVPEDRVEFGLRCTRAEAKSRLGIDQRRPLIVYTGKLYLGMKELQYLLTAASRMPASLFLFTGGQPSVIEAVTEELRDRGIENVRLTGMLEHPAESRFHQQAADVLVTYYSVEDHRLAHHQLPNKLAEYMTTGNPIVAADFPAARDLLNAENSLLIKPHDVDALVGALEFAIGHPRETADLAARAQRDIATRTTESLGADLTRFLAAVADGLGIDTSAGDGR